MTTGAFVNGARSEFPVSCSAISSISELFEHTKIRLSFLSARDAERRSTTESKMYAKNDERRRVGAEICM